MGLFYFLIGVIVGALLLVILPLFVAVLGATLAIGIFVALPLVVAGLILIGITPCRLRWATVCCSPRSWSHCGRATVRGGCRARSIQPLSSAGSCNVVSCPRTGSASASSRLRAPFHSLAGRTCPSLPIWSIPQ